MKTRKEISYVARGLKLLGKGKEKRKEYISRAECIFGKIFGKIFGDIYDLKRSVDSHLMELAEPSRVCLNYHGKGFECLYGSNCECRRRLS